MVKLSAMVMLALGLSVSAQAGGNNGCPWFEPFCKAQPQTPVRMPEPSAVPELLLGMAALGGYIVWRERKQKSLKSKA
jgi:hypothetical protein